MLACMVVYSMVLHARSMSPMPAPDSDMMEMPPFDISDMPPPAPAPAPHMESNYDMPAFGMLSWNSFSLGMSSGGELEHWVFIFITICM